MRVSGTVRFVTAGVGTSFIGESAAEEVVLRDPFLADCAPACKSVGGQGDLSERIRAHQLQRAIIVCPMTELLKVNKALATFFMYATVFGSSRNASRRVFWLMPVSSCGVRG